MDIWFHRGHFLTFSRHNPVSWYLGTLGGLGGVSVAEDNLKAEQMRPAVPVTWNPYPDLQLGSACVTSGVIPGVPYLSGRGLPFLGIRWFSLSGGLPMWPGLGKEGTRVLALPSSHAAHLDGGFLLLLFYAPHLRCPPHLWFAFPAPDQALFCESVWEPRPLPPPPTPRQPSTRGRCKEPSFPDAVSPLDLDSPASRTGRNTFLLIILGPASGTLSEQHRTPADAGEGSWGGGKGLLRS